VLNEIAILDKKGHYDNCYHPKPEYSQNISAETVSVVLGYPWKTWEMKKTIDMKPLQKTRSSQLESSDMSEDIVRTPEHPSPGTSIPYGLYKICGGFEPFDSKYLLLFCQLSNMCSYRSTYAIKFTIGHF